jgi:6-phosphogluconolactonase (cycloisomerase 2 family)
MSGRTFGWVCASFGAAILAGFISLGCGHSVDFGVAPPGQPGPPAHQFSYVSNQGDDKISEFSIDSKTGALSLIGTISAGSSSGLKGLVATFKSHVVFAANATDSKIYAFKFAPGSGKKAGILTPLAITNTGAGTAPTALALDLSGNFLYATDVANNQLLEYRLNAGSGVLKPIKPGSVPTGKMPVSVVASAHSAELFVANSGDGTISGFSINPQGAVTANGFINSLGPSTGAPQWLGVDSIGSGVYDADMDPGPGGSVSAFTLSGDGKALIFVTGGPFASGNGTGFPAWVTVDSPARFVYTANPAPNNNLSIYKIQSNASLGTATLAPVPALNLNSVTSDMSGGFLYATDAGQGLVFQFTVDSTTGTPTAITGGPVSTENPSNPTSHPFQAIVTR